MRLLIVLALVVFFCASNAGADCKEDCEGDLNIATQECQTTYNSPENPDPDRLQSCLDQAKSDYDSCLEQCKDEWDTHED